MSGFTAIPPAPTLPVADSIVGDGWWPAFSLAAFKIAARVPGTVTDARAREAVIGGMLSAQAELTGWHADRLAAGDASLAAVTIGGTIDGEARAMILYRRAVYAYAAADLAESHDDIGASDIGRHRTQERAAGGTELLRTATLAIRDLLGKRRSKVALL